MADQCSLLAYQRRLRSMSDTYLNVCVTLHCLSYRTVLYSLEHIVKNSYQLRMIVFTHVCNFFSGEERFVEVGKIWMIIPGMLDNFFKEHSVASNSLTGQCQVIIYTDSRRLFYFLVEFRRVAVKMITATKYAINRVLKPTSKNAW